MTIFEPTPCAGDQIVSIELDKGSIWATPNGGSLRIEDNPKANLVFLCAQKFSLSFVQIGGATPLAWPTFEVTPGGPLGWQCRTRSPEVPAGAEAPFYKYTVNAGGLTLDPIVIVDKKPA
jgi:hypothetical protein